MEKKIEEFIEKWTLENVIWFLGWQGGTVHQVKNEIRTNFNNILVYGKNRAYNTMFNDKSFIKCSEMYLELLELE